MTDEGEDRTNEAGDEAASPAAASPWEAFARPRAEAPASDEHAETLEDDDEMPELGDDDEIDDGDLTSPAAPIAFRAAPRPSLPAIDDLTPAPPSAAPLPLPVPPASTAVDAAASIEGAPLPAAFGPAEVAVPVEGVVPTDAAAPVPAQTPAFVPLAAYAYTPSPIFDVPHGARAALLHVPLSIFLGALGLGLAAALADGGLGPFEPMVPLICGLGVLSGFVHVFASFPTILSAKPATKTLLVSSGLAFGAAALVGLLASTPLRRMGSGASQLRAYPEFFCIAASFSAAAYLATAVVARRSLRCLLLLRPEGDPLDEIADSRAMLAAVTGVAAAVLTLAIFLGLRLPLSHGVPAFLFMVVVGGAVARTQALSEGVALSLDDSSPLRARLVPRIALAQHAYVACAFLGSFVLAMSIRIGMLRAISYTRYGSGAGISAATIDRALFVAIPFFTALATASFWIPKLAIPRESAVTPLVAPRGLRVALVLAVVSLGMLLRLEDVYDRRVSNARDELVAKDERARDEDRKDTP